MGRKPLFSSNQPLPETSGPRLGLVVLLAAAIMVVMLGGVLGSGLDQNAQDTRSPDGGNPSEVIPNTGRDRQEGMNDLRRSVECAFRGEECPPEADDS
jgi:hypothetical protein